MKEILKINQKKIKYNNKKYKIFQDFKTNLAYFKIRFQEMIQYKAAAIAGVLTQFVWA